MPEVVAAVAAGRRAHRCGNGCVRRAGEQIDAAPFRPAEADHDERAEDGESHDAWSDSLQRSFSKLEARMESPMGQTAMSTMAMSSGAARKAPVSTETSA